MPNIKYTEQFKIYKNSEYIGVNKTDSHTSNI